ncbi:MAG: pyruvate kinase, partial [Proteobacteria bacterium]|nr:pyruvate kinase [Pseudomonadota bacterium]
MSKQTGRAPSQGHASRIRKSISAIQELRQAALAVEVDFAKILAQVNPRFRGSARNLLHYLAVRQHDIRDLQHELGRLGLSSLGRMEAHVMASLNAVLEALNLLIKRPQPEDLEDSAAISFERGLALLAQNTEAILGPGDATRMTRVMVTVPGEAAENPLLIRNLLAQGMNIMRINCAHDTPQVWSKMVRHLRRAQAGQGRPCKVSFDLAGPKLRTGPMQAGESVIKWRPFKDRLGRTVAPVEVSLVCAASYTEGGMSGAVPIAGDLPALARTGDHVELVDARGKQRCLLVTGKEDHGCRCQADSTAYVTPGNSVALRRKRKLIGRSRVAMFPSQKTTAI